jgi:hypothetical protein
MIICAVMLVSIKFNTAEWYRIGEEYNAKG